MAQLPAGFAMAKPWQDRAWDSAGDEIGSLIAANRWCLGFSRTAPVVPNGVAKPWQQNRKVAQHPAGFAMAKP